MESDAGGPCTAHTQCDDGMFCNGVEQCSPSDALADADGCVAGDSPCAMSSSCDEASDTCGSPCSAADTDVDGDGHSSVECGGADCDDTDAESFPDNLEVCDLDGHDEDCDPTTVGDRDLDGDEHTDARCCNEDAAGDFLCGEDCDDTRRGSNPNVPEVCDGRDNNCDGAVDEELLQSVFVDADRDLFGDTSMPIDACPGRVGTSAAAIDDCNDDDPYSSPQRQEFLDGQDNDCDVEVDENLVVQNWYPDADADGYGDPDGTIITSDDDLRDDGYSLLPLDCDDTGSNVGPRLTELCNAMDDDCDGEANYVLGVNDWEDDDGDGYPDAACPGVTSDRADCDDTNPSTFPGASERCDQRDNDCDGEVDQGGICDTPPGEEFVLISAGTFTMGSPVDELGHYFDEPQHTVTLTRAFWIHTTEVTQGAYQERMGSNPSSFSSCGSSCPVDGVTWQDAAAYANALSASEGLPACYGSDGSVIGGATVYDCEGYRLPTDAEWEYAARAGTTTATPAGDLVEGGCADTTLPPIAWFCGNSGGTTRMVGTRLPNAWGLYDMLGNLWEWTSDWYESDLGTMAATNPIGPGASMYRAIRGGSWFTGTNNRSAERGGNQPDDGDQYKGFRLARTAP